MKIITTSWDDGHPLDFKLSELLAKYGLKGSFYIPRYNQERSVMKEEDIIRMSACFEIGGHTLNHVNLSTLSARAIKSEVAGCYEWLQTLLGKTPKAFCPPFGGYHAKAISLIKDTGFRVIRTTELLSPFAVHPPVIPGTLQIYEHSRFTLLRHLLKRGRFKSLAVWVRGGCKRDLLKMTEQYIDYIDTHGGCLHLWGHSWEIDQYGLWNTLEQIFKIISNRPSFQYLENGELTPGIH